MNDERSLVKQIKWLKQEINNLKIAKPQSSSNISFFSQRVKYDIPVGAEYSTFVAEALPVGEGGPNFFGTILEASDSGTIVIVRSFSYRNGVAKWDLDMLAPERRAEFIICSTSPCTVSVYPEGSNV